MVINTGCSKFALLLHMKKYKTGPFLSQINFPEDLREKFNIDDLPGVSEDLRQYIIDVICAAFSFYILRLSPFRHGYSLIKEICYY